MKPEITKVKTSDHLNRLGRYLSIISLGIFIGFLLTFRAIPESDRKLVPVGVILLEIISISACSLLLKGIAVVMHRKLLREDLSNDKSVA